MVKLVLKELFFGVIFGCFLLVAVVAFTHFVAPSISQGILDNFLMTALRFIVISVGFSVSAIVHDIDRFHTGINVAINAAIGISVILIVSFFSGWFEPQNYHIIAFTVVLSVLVMLVVWFIVFVHNKDEVRKINKRLREQASKDI